MPLVWGLAHGPQQGIFDLSFSVPSECAERLRSGAADIGLVPCAELNRQPLSYIPEVGIACVGAVRSILLISKVPPQSIRTVALDNSSRTSVMLARIILQRKFKADPVVISHPPDLTAMLQKADAALLIGDPALSLSPDRLPYQILDLGAEWMDLTGLPMVFAVWAGRRGVLSDPVRQTFLDSWHYGRTHIEDIVQIAAPLHGVSEDQAREYLTRYIVFELSDNHHLGLAQYLKWAAELDAS